MMRNINSTRKIFEIFISTFLIGPRSTLKLILLGVHEQGQVPESTDRRVREGDGGLPGPVVFHTEEQYN